MTQQEAFEILKMGYNIFLTGAPGSGKTFLLNQYVNYLKENNRAVAVTASTGIAATHMNGTTIHSWSGLGIKERISEFEMAKILKKPYLRKRFKNTNVLIIDEVSMLHAFQFDLLNRICQEFKDSGDAFGGMQVICSGDFFQLPPIAKGSQAKFITESKIWQAMEIKMCYLTEQYRQQESDELFTLLNYIRGNMAHKAREVLLNNRNNQEPIDSLAPTKLFTHNVDVDAINNLELSKIQQKEEVFRMYSKGNSRIAQSLIKSCLAPEILLLKQGAKVMFIKNSFDQGYVNGTLGHVVKFNKQGLPVVKTFNGNYVSAEPASWLIEEDGKIKAEITQVPLRLAWAITVHKSQGMNLDAAEIDLSKSFIEGMGYVALSRLKSLAGLKLIGVNEMALAVNNAVLVLDKVLQEKSKQVATFFSQMDDEEKQNIQKRFLQTLPIIAFGVGVGDPEQDKVSTYDQTKELVKDELSIKEIAQERKLSEGTIIRHLEILKENNEDINLDYLRLPEKRFEVIQTAFKESGDTILSPVRDILGQTFSYTELRIARLFLEE